VVTVEELFCGTIPRKPKSFSQPATGANDAAPSSARHTGFASNTVAARGGALYSHVAVAHLWQ
jgi:predicted outer membrane repeat protein